MIELRRVQLSFGDGLISAEVEDLSEDWMAHADVVLADEQLMTTVYEALAKRRPKSRSRGRRATPAEVVLRLLDLLRAGSIFQLLHIGASICDSAFRLLVLCSEFFVLQTNQYLTFFDLVTLFDADPCEAAGDLGVDIDLVMSDHVASRGEHNPADVSALSRGANDIHF